MARERASLYTAQAVVAEPAVSTSATFPAARIPAGEVQPEHPATTVVRRVGDNAGNALLGIWMAGAGISLLTLVVGLVHLTWLASRARPVEHGRWAALAGEVAAALELKRRVAILQSEHPTLLVTWGLTRPKVILPAASADWSDDRARIVLRHEFAHIRRGDWAIFMAAELLRAAYWFNPLVWMACRLVRQESENACDDVVLNAGIAGPDYATHLLDLARTLNANRRRSRPALPAPAMARPSSLQGRISAMLNDKLNRTPLTPSIRVASVVALLAVTVLLAGVGAQRFYTFSGSVLDSTNRAVTGTKLVITSAASGAKHEVQSDQTGHFDFVGLPPGDYALEASVPGFSTFTDTISIVGRDVDRAIALRVGSLEETITVTSSVSAAPASAGQTDALREEQRKIDQRKAAAPGRQREALEKCAGTVAGPIGGQILPPLRLTNVNPRYPEDLRAAGVDGVVTLEALIGADGNIQDVRAVSSPHPALAAAAIEAVRQWQYTPTMLNCVPVEVPMKITTRFNSQQ